MARSIAAVQDAIFEYVLPCFEAMSSTEGMLQEYHEKKHRGMGWHHECWRLFDLGFMFMRVGRYNEALETLELARVSLREAFSADFDALDIRRCATGHCTRRCGGTGIFKEM